MNFQVGDIVKVYDEAEDNWFEGEILEVYDNGAMVEYETEYWRHVKTVKYQYLKRVSMNRKEIWDLIYKVLDEVDPGKLGCTYYMYENEVKFEELLGKTIDEIYGAEEGSDVILFRCRDNSVYVMYHEQDCCENVDINDICGDINCLIGRPILKAEEVVHVSGEENCPDSLDKYDSSYTWTFYTLATIKGYVTIRWYGESNGYYSERVALCKIK